MIEIRLRQWLGATIGATIIVSAAFAGGQASAADASPWHTDSHSAVRLIAGDPTQSLLSAGIEIELGPGWKTYWRYPGDSGVPPRFDFSQSENVNAVTVRWPAPHRFTDENGNTIGYKERVVFPLEVVPADAKKPVTLRLKLDYAVCEKVCIPAQDSAELPLGTDASTLAPTLAAATALVPKPTSLGDAGPLAVRAVRRDGKDRVAVDVAAPAGDSVVLFAEGPTPDWALPLPEPVSGGPAGLQRYAFALDGLPPGASAQGAHVTLTLVAGSKAIEVTAPLD
jgi:DsbC/DsbD-like thiol-disulfide interchange protein